MLATRLLLWNHRQTSEFSIEILDPIAYPPSGKETPSKYLRKQHLNNPLQPRENPSSPPFATRQITNSRNFFCPHTSILAANTRPAARRRPLPPTPRRRRSLHNPRGSEAFRPPEKHCRRITMGDAPPAALPCSRQPSSKARSETQEGRFTSSHTAPPPCGKRARDSGKQNRTKINTIEI